MSNFTGKKRSKKRDPKFQGKDTFSKKECGREEEFNAQKSRPNDWRWYAQNEQLLKDTASLPYSWPLGTKLNMGSVAGEFNKGSLPGIMAIFTSPSFGYSDNPNSPINVAARNIYSYVRHANAGHANYDAPDLMLYLCAMDSIYSYLSYLKRIYGVAMTYSYTNRYYPKAMLTAMNVNFDDVQNHLADFRAFINSFAVKVGSMCIPASMSFMAKHMWMYEGYYSDSNQDKAQTYLFVPAGFFKYTLDKDGAGMLAYSKMQFQSGRPLQMRYVTDGLLYTVDQLIEYANTLLGPVLSSEDMNIMSGDILKAFGPSNIYTVSGISEDYVVLPTYSEEVLDQIQNAVLIGEYANPTAGAKSADVFDGKTYGLHQDATKGYLIFTPGFMGYYIGEDTEDPGQDWMFANKFINFEHGNVGPENTMEATRLSNIATAYTEYTDSSVLDSDYAGFFTIQSIGSEVAHFARVYNYVLNGSSWTLRFYNFSAVNLYMIDFGDGTDVTAQGYKDLMDIAVSSIQNVNLIIQLISQFNRHPGYVLTSYATSEVAGASAVQKRSYGRLNGVHEDINYYSIVDESNLRVMSETALLSQFNITQYGRAAQ